MSLNGFLGSFMVLSFSQRLASYWLICLNTINTRTWDIKAVSVSPVQIHTCVVVHHLYKLCVFTVYLIYKRRRMLWWHQNLAGVEALSSIMWEIKDCSVLAVKQWRQKRQHLHRRFRKREIVRKEKADNRKTKDMQVWHKSMKHDMTWLF